MPEVDYQRLMKTIAIVDSSPWSGHREMYLKLFCKAVLNLGYDLMIFCQNPEHMKEWSDSLYEGNNERVRAFKLVEPAPSWVPFNTLRNIFDSFFRWRNLTRAFRKAVSVMGKAPDLVFFVWLDSYRWVNRYKLGYFTYMKFKYRWSGLYFHPRHLRLNESNHLLNDPEKIFTSDYCSSVAVLDEGVSEKLQNKLGGKSVIVFPDVTDESPSDPDYEITREILDRASDRKIIGLLGGLGFYKGLLTLMEAAKKSVDKKWFFVFAGELIEESFSHEERRMIRDYMMSEPSNVYFHFERIPDESQFNALVSVCDVLFAAYNDFPHSSNILTKAALYDKPVIASKHYCMGERVERFHMGATIQEGNVGDCVNALENILDKKGFDYKRADFEGYRQLHSMEKFYLAFEKVMENA